MNPKPGFSLLSDHYIRSGCMLTPYSYSFGSFPRSGSSPTNSSNNSVPLNHPHPPHHPPGDESSPSEEQKKELIQCLRNFSEVEFDFGHFDWSRNATFKFVLIELSCPGVCEKKSLVRGLVSAEYHADIAEPILRQIDSGGLDHNVIGGGRIRYVATKKSLTVYGYSIGYPWLGGEFGNKLVSEIIKRNFPHLEVDWSNEGY